MKKLFISLLALTVLFGCSTSTKSKIEKVVNKGIVVSSDDIDISTFVKLDEIKDTKLKSILESSMVFASVQLIDELEVDPKTTIHTALIAYNIKDNDGTLKESELEEFKLVTTYNYEDFQVYLREDDAKLFFKRKDNGTMNQIQLQVADVYLVNYQVVK